MEIAFNIFIGIITGGLVAALATVGGLKPTSQVKLISTYVIGVVFGALGAQAADQLLDYGPTFLNSNFVPAIVGGIVLAFVVIFASKKWLRL